MKAYDFEIVELAISVMFHASLPPTYLSLSPLAADLKEDFEVSNFTECSSKRVVIDLVEHPSIVQ